MPSKGAKRNRAGGVKKENGTTAGSTDEIVKPAQAQRTDAEKQRTASSSSALRSNEDDGIVTARADDEESDHGNAPGAKTRLATPSSTVGEVPTSTDIDVASVKEKDNSTRIQELERSNARLERILATSWQQVKATEAETAKAQSKITDLEAQLQAAEEDALRCQEQWRYTEAKMAESQCRIAELEVQLQEAKDKVAVLLGNRRSSTELVKSSVSFRTEGQCCGFRQSRYEGVASKGKPSSRQSFSAAKARHGASRNRPGAKASSKEKPASHGVGVTVGYVMTATPIIVLRMLVRGQLIKQNRQLMLQARQNKEIEGAVEDNEMGCKDHWRFRFKRPQPCKLQTLGANEFVLDGSSVYPEGTISSKGADAAIKFLKKLCGWLIIEKQDSGDHRQDNSNEESLHAVRGGKVAKHPARGAPYRGGGGGAPQRERGTFKDRGRGNQSNFGKHRRGFN